MRRLALIGALALLGSCGGPAADPSVGLVDPCQRFDEPLDATLSIPCDPRHPLYCATDGACRPLGQDGDPCTTSSECHSKFCDLPTGRCADYSVDRCVDG